MVVRYVSKNKSEERGVTALLVLVGVLLFLPFVLVSYFYYNGLKKKYLDSSDAQRIHDTRRMFNTLTTFVMSSVLSAGVLTFGVWALLGGVLSVLGIDEASVQGPILMFFTALIFICFLYVEYLVARRIAVLSLGIVVDESKDLLVFPFENKSSTLGDWLTLRAMKRLAYEDTVPLSAITKMTRGYGKELYVHGDFGSRGIFMSDKQKRDEVLAAVQELAGKKAMMTEIESY